MKILVIFQDKSSLKRTTYNFTKWTQDFYYWSYAFQAVWQRITQVKLYFTYIRHTNIPRCSKSKECTFHYFTWRFTPIEKWRSIISSTCRTTITHNLLLKCNQPYKWKINWYKLFHYHQLAIYNCLDVKCYQYPEPTNGRLSCRKDVTSTINCHVVCNAGFDVEFLQAESYKCSPDGKWTVEPDVMTVPWPNCIAYG